MFGVSFPIYAAITGGVTVVGRFFYALGYKSKGPGGRMVGAGITDVAIVAAFVGAMYSSYLLITSA